MRHQDRGKIGKVTVIDTLVLLGRERHVTARSISGVYEEQTATILFTFATIAPNPSGQADSEY